MRDMRFCGYHFGLLSGSGRGAYLSGLGRWILGALLAGWAGATPVWGQLEVKWSCGHRKLLLYESAPVVVTVVNHSGQAMNFGAGGNAVLSFDIEDAAHVRIGATGRPVVTQTNAIVLDEGTLALEVDLFSAYRLVRSQQYRVIPRIEFGGTTFLGKARDMEIQPGMEVMRRDYGMPDSGEGRTVLLRLLHREREARLFFRLDSRDGYCLVAQDLGSFLRVVPPSLERDGGGRFHVLHQATPKQFAHTVFRADGRRESVTYYQGEPSVMKMTRGGDGVVVVSGGMVVSPAAVGAGYVSGGEKPITDFSTTIPRRDPSTGKFTPWWRKKGED